MKPRLYVFTDGGGERNITNCVKPRLYVFTDGGGERNITNCVKPRLYVFTDGGGECNITSCVKPRLYVFTDGGGECNITNCVKPRLYGGTKGNYSNIFEVESRRGNFHTHCCQLLVSESSRANARHSEHRATIRRIDEITHGRQREEKDKKIRWECRN